MEGLKILLLASLSAHKLRTLWDDNIVHKCNGLPLHMSLTLDPTACLTTTLILQRQRWLQYCSRNELHRLEECVY